MMMRRKTKSLILSIVDTVLALLVIVMVCFGGIIIGTKYPLDMGMEDVRWEGTIELDDTRRVPCVATGYGMSCDWLHADGTDAHISEEGTTQ